MTGEGHELDGRIVGRGGVRFVGRAGGRFGIFRALMEIVSLHRRDGRQGQQILRTVGGDRQRESAVHRDVGVQQPRLGDQFDGRILCCLSFKVIFCFNKWQLCMI